MRLNKKNYLYLNIFINLLNQYIDFVQLRATNTNELSIHVNKGYLFKSISFLKKSTLLQFKTLSDICVVDNLLNKNINSRVSSSRFQVIYNLLSIKYFFRLFCSICVKELDPNLESLNSLFMSSNWLEREVWDMFGIFFTNHYDLRRILTDYGFDGYPFRKDFPLSGYIELRYNDELFVVTYDPVELAQEFRFFDFSSPWEKK